MFLDAFTALNQFVTDWPSWKLIAEAETYLLTANPSSQQNMFDFNPENPNAIFRPGPYMNFYLSTLGQVTYDGKILVFRCRGYTFKVNGPNQTIAIVP